MATGAHASGSVGNEVDLNREWAERAFSSDPDRMRVDRLTVVHEDGPGDTKIGRCAAGGPLRLGEKTYTRGIGVNSRSVLRVTLSRPAARFLADVGLDRNVDRTVASVRFHVSVGGKDVFATDVIRPTGAVLPIDVPLSGATSFDLIADTGGDSRAFDQADWADARVELKDGSTLWLDELAVADGVSGDLPFSFVYGGQPSSALIGQWQRRVTETVVDASKRRRVLTLTDPATRLEIRAVCDVYTDTPGVDWTLHFTNKGEKDTPVLEKVNAVDVTIWSGTATGTPVLHGLRATSGVDDWVPYDQALPAGKRIAFAPQRGRSSCGACPFFNLDWGRGGVVTAIGWTGQWAASVEHVDASLRLRAGMQHMRLKLRPGETIRSPRILLMQWSDPARSPGAGASARPDPHRPYNLFRRTMLNHIVPKVGGKTITPPIAQLSTAFYEMDKGTADDVLSHLSAVEGLGFEFFWLDAYYGKDNFPTVGNYVLPLDRGLNRRRYPNGIAPIGQAAHKAGMKFLWWVEPERICPGTLMAAEHPDWVVLPGNGGWGMLNLALPEARKYATDFLLKAIKEYGVDCLRVDNAVDFRSMWAILDRADPDRVGMAEIRYVEGLYRMWDDIRAANPHLFIDNCASGGQRIDLETCSRSIPLWRTDATIHPLLVKDYNQAALQNQCMTVGLSRFVPFNVSGQMGATPYLFRSGFNAGISFCEDVRPADYPRDLLKQAIAEGKRIRKYYFGNLHPITEVTTRDRDWCVIQYHRPEEQDGIVIAFRRHRSPFAAFTFLDLCEIDSDGDYELTEYHGYEPSKPLRMKGAAFLKHTGRIEELPGSLLIEYRRRDG